MYAVLRESTKTGDERLTSVGQYQKKLATVGATNITRCNLGSRVWWGGPWMATYLLTATKPKIKTTVA